MEYLICIFTCDAPLTFGHIWYNPSYLYYYILDPSGEADNREEETVCVETLKHALYRLPVDSKGDAWSPKIQTAADYVI